MSGRLLIAAVPHNSFTNVQTKLLRLHHSVSCTCRQEAESSTWEQQHTADKPSCRLHPSHPITPSISSPSAVSKMPSISAILLDLTPLYPPTPAIR